MEKGQDRLDKTVETLRRWQALERKAIERTAEMMERTENKLVRQFLEIIRNDSVQHHRVQQFIIDSLTTTPISLRPDELGEMWAEIEEHDALEKEVIEIAKELRDNCKMFVQRSLLDYLLYDEQKHDMLFQELEKFKKNLYPYG